MLCKASEGKKWMEGKKERLKQMLVWCLVYVLTGVPLGPERPLSPGIPAGPCYKGAGDKLNLSSIG